METRKITILTIFTLFILFTFFCTTAADAEKSWKIYDVGEYAPSGHIIVAPNFLEIPTGVKFQRFLQLRTLWKDNQPARGWFVQAKFVVNDELIDIQTLVGTDELGFTSVEIPSSKEEGYLEVKFSMFDGLTLPAITVIHYKDQR